MSPHTAGEGAHLLAWLINVATDHGTPFEVGIAIPLETSTSLAMKAT
jgi:hypothetical protein